MFSFFKTQKTQKIIALLLLGVLLVAIPLTVWYGQQQQQTQQKAATELYRGGLDSCGHVKVTQIIESPVCTTNRSADLTSYTTTAYIVSADGGTYSNVLLHWYGFWCKDASEMGGDPTNSFACLKNKQETTKTVTINSTAQSFPITVNPVENSVNYGACGRYQTDFVLSYTYNGKSCTFGTSPLDFSTTANVLGYGYCWSKTADCSVPSTTPTATPTIPVTDTPTATPTPTQHKECRQNACILVPGQGSDLCSTDSDCQSVTPTDTPTPTTPNTPSDTPTPTVPFVATNTPKPTLPPTGPGNVILGVGLIGAVAAVIGTIVILAL